MVIAIIALLIGLLLPAIASARLTSQRTVSMSNLRQNTFYMNYYITDNKDVFLNPFANVNNPVTAWDDRGVVLEPASEAQANNHQWGQYAWDYAVTYSTSGTETFGYHWMSHLLYSDNTNASRYMSGFSPGDFAMRRFLRENPDGNAQGDLNWIFPVSYWYPPCFWQDSTRFSLATPTRNPGGPTWFIRRNRLSDVFVPSQKVQIFERADFYTKRRGNAKESAWNAPLARTNVAMVDGSGKTVAMASLIAQTTTAPGLTPTSPGELLQPAGTWAPGGGELTGFFGWTSDPQAAAFNFDTPPYQTPAKPAYFWATRQGIRGIDVNK